MYEFKLPDLGEGIHEGELLKWHVAVGDSLKEDDALVDVETDKAAVTIPSPRGGKVVALEGKPGDTLHVGAVIARIDDGSSDQSSSDGDETPAGEDTLEKPGQKPEPSRAGGDAGRTAPQPAAPSAPSRAGGRVPAAPATRRLARERGVDIGQVPATGPGGRVTREDVERFAAGGALSGGDEEPAAAGAAGPIPYYQLEPLPDFTQLGEVETEPVISIRRKVARKMVTSMIVVPHVAHMDDADVTTLENFRREERKRRGEEPGARLSLLPFIVKAVVECLREFPMFNASLDPQRELIIYKKFYNVGFAADTPRGLVVPVIEGADRKSVLDISAEILELAVSAREGSIDASALRGGTFTITNVGPLGGTRLVPTINYPEVAILGMGRAAERAVVRDGEIVIRTILPLTLAFDHRVADGADAARFVNSLVHRLEHPLSWLIEKRG